jgi:hypothetical protein
MFPVILLAIPQALELPASDLRLFHLSGDSSSGRGNIADYCGKMQNMVKNLTQIRPDYGDDSIVAGLSPGLSQIAQTTGIIRVYVWTSHDLKPAREWISGRGDANDDQRPRVLDLGDRLPITSRSRWP